MRALITGASGFVGRYMIKFLVEKKYEVIAAFHPEWPKELEHENIYAVQTDITDRNALRVLLKEYLPDEVYHLAGIAVTTSRERVPYYKVNLCGTVNLLEAIREITPLSRVLFVGSANGYGPVPELLQPIDEDLVLRPVNHYAASKAAADMAACAYAEEGLHIVRARPFNHTGPGQITDYVCSHLAKQVAEIRLGLKEPSIEAGNIEAARDFTDIRDVVRAYWLLLQKGKPGEVYNICSQKAYSIREIISLLAGIAGIDIKINVRTDLLRKTDIPILVGSREKIYQATGWEPEIPFEDTLKDLLEFWRQKLI